MPESKPVFATVIQVTHTNSKDDLLHACIHASPSLVLSKLNPWKLNLAKNAIIRIPENCTVVPMSSQVLTLA